MIARALLLLAAVSLAGCASNRCLSTDANYQRAETLPPLKPTDGLKLPESPSALKIPALAGTPAALPEGQCLDTPPPLKESAPPAPAAAAPTSDAPAGTGDTATDDTASPESQP